MSYPIAPNCTQLLATTVAQNDIHEAVGACVGI